MARDHFLTSEEVESLHEQSRAVREQSREICEYAQALLMWIEPIDRERHRRQRELRRINSSDRSP